VAGRVCDRSGYGLVAVGLLPTTRGETALDLCGGAPAEPITPPEELTPPDEPLDEPSQVEPDTRVHAFYYPWYRTPDLDGEWVQWQRYGRLPPDDLASNFYPQLGACSSNDSEVVAQHMRWMRDAGIGVVLVSWAGVGHPTNQPVELVLDAAAEAGLKVAWHIEPYRGRTAESVARDIRAIYARYGQHPAFLRVDWPTRSVLADQLLWSTIALSATAGSVYTSFMSFEPARYASSAARLMRRTSRLRSQASHVVISSVPPSVSEPICADRYSRSR
jgi:Glycosyl hydrolase family 99